MLQPCRTSEQRCCAAPSVTSRRAGPRPAVKRAGSAIWSAIEVPGSAALDKGGLARVYSLSCPSTGKCSAAGFYKDASGHPQAFVANES